MSQRHVDLTSDCQRRVAAETGILQSAAMLVVPAGTAGVQLDPVVVRLLAVTTGNVEVLPMRAADYLRDRSGGFAFEPTQAAYALIGRTLYLSPDPSVDTTLTIVYTQRTVDLDETLTLELTGGYARLCEQLVGAYALLDDGQPELAAQGLADYQAELQRLRLHAQRVGVGVASRRIGMRP